MAAREQGRAFRPKFDSAGLLCAVAQDADSGEVLMVAFMDQAALDAARKLLSEVAPSPQMSEQELLTKAREALQLSDDAIEHLEVEVEFSDGTEIEAEA